MGNNNLRSANSYNNCAQGITVCCQTCSSNCPKEEFVIFKSFG